MSRPAQLNIRCSAELKERLESLAAADKRTLSAYVEIVLEQHVLEQYVEQRDKPKRAQK